MDIEQFDNYRIIRHPQRPSAPQYINIIFPDFIALCGDRFFGEDSSVIGGIASIDGKVVTIIGNVKGRCIDERLQTNFSMAKPEGYRKILRLMKQAEKFKRPVICLVDTIGAYPGIEAEERGQANAIANCLVQAINLKTPVISILLGDGGSGGALALCVSDRLMALEHSTLSVISPKACASILWKDSTRDQEAAAFLKFDAKSLLELGVVDEIVPEPNEGAHTSEIVMAEKLRGVLSNEIRHLMKLPIGGLVRKRKQKYRNIGSQYLLKR